MLNLTINSKIDGKLEKLFNNVVKVIKTRSPLLAREMGNMDIVIGPASDPRYGNGSGAMQPCYVGDSYLKGAEIGRTGAMDSLFKADPNKIGFKYQFNPRTGKFDMAMQQRPAGYAADAVDLIGAQLMAPGQISWFAKPFMEPLSWSVAEELVSVQPGTDPWATVGSLALASFGGGIAMVEETGAPNNTMSRDVNVQTGLMTSQIINLAVTYSISIEETQRAQSGSSTPYAGQLITQKQRYARWVLEFITAALIYYGNASTDTKGLLTVNSVTAFTGTSLSAIAAGAGASKGELAYEQLATLVNAFLNASQNKLTRVDITMAPLAFNLFGSLPYSQIYSAESPMVTFEKNFNAGLGKSKQKVKFNFRSDPLIDTNSVNPFNSIAHDYLLLSSPEIATGVDEETEALLAFLAPLMDFVFPVSPGPQGQQYKTLRRVGGLYAPYTPAIAAYSGWGV